MTVRSGWVLALLLTACLKQPPRSVLSQELAELRSEYDVLAASYEALERDTALCRTDREDLERRLSQMESEVSRLAGALTSCRDRRDELANDCGGATTHLQAELDRCLMLLGDPQEAAAATASEGTDLMSIFATSTRRLQACTAEGDALRLEIDPLRDLDERLRALAEQLGGHGVTVARRDGRLYLDVESDLLFPSGKAKLSAAGRELLGGVGAALADRPVALVVEGHTDDEPLAAQSRFSSNLELSQARARASADELLNAGVGADDLFVVPRGTLDLLPCKEGETTKDCRARQRRVSVALLPNLDVLDAVSAFSASSDE